MPDRNLEQRLCEVADLLARIHGALVGELDRLGYAPGEISVSGPELAQYRLQADPACGDIALLGEWRDGRGQCLGSLVFHADGTFFVEHDVVKIAPRRPDLFVEAVTAWGRGAEIRSEPRILPMVL